MKIVKWLAFFSLFVIEQRSFGQQSKQPLNYAAWQHPVILGLQQKANYLTPIPRTNKGDYFIQLAILNSKNKNIYFVTTIGYIFDSLSLGSPLFNAILNKQVDPYNYYNNDVTQLYLKEITEAYRLLREKGNDADKFLSNAGYVDFTKVKTASTSFQKMIALDKIFYNVVKLSMLFNLNLSELKDSIYEQKISYWKSYDKGKLLAHDMRKDSYVEYINADKYAQLGKAVLKPETEKLFLYSWKNLSDPLDSLQLKKEKLPELVHDKADVFAIYRNWIEWQVQDATDYSQSLISASLKKSQEQTKNNNVLYAIKKEIPATQAEQNKLLAQLQNYKAFLTTKIAAAILPDNDILFYTVKEDCEKLPRKKWITNSGWQQVYTTSSSLPPGFKSGSFTRGQKYYYLYDHRGNVMATVSDRKIPVSLDGVTVDHYEPDVVTATDYSSFGAELEGRTYSNEIEIAENYNGKRKDKETGYLDYGFRIYDPRIARFLSVDPLTKQYPELTPYQFASNSPIFGIDKDGKELAGNQWLFDIWLKWTFGDPTGVKRLQSGIEQKVAVQTHQMSYNNEQVPSSVQTDLDHINNVQANIKIATGISKVAAFNIKTSFDVISTTAPIGEGIEVTLKGTEIIYNGIKAERVLVGSSKKVAVIGRDFDARVLKFAAGFEKQTGVKVETFRASAGAQYSWGELLKEYKGNVPDEIAKQSLIYRENEAWAEKIKKEGYKVLDTGLGTKDVKGTFYGMETKTIFEDK